MEWRAEPRSAGQPFGATKATASRSSDAHSVRSGSGTATQPLNTRPAGANGRPAPLATNASTRAGGSFTPIPDSARRRHLRNGANIIASPTQLPTHTAERTPGTPVRYAGT